MLMKDCRVSVMCVNGIVIRSKDYKDCNVTGLSKAQVFADENRHNAAVRKKTQKLWFIPVVYGGMNTK